MQNHTKVQKIPSYSDEKATDAVKVVVCIDDAASSHKVISHALAIADSLDAEIMLVHVIEPQDSMSVPLDPVEWDLRRRQAQLLVSRLASEKASSKRPFSTKILEGRLVNEICGCVSGRPQDIVALFRRKEQDRWQFGSKLHHIHESNLGSILLVPEESAEIDASGFRHVIVPLDGSSRAESVIPVAVKIAQNQDAELVLVHATPEPSLTNIGPPQSEDAALKDQLQGRNERVAREYLGRVRDRVRSLGVRVLIRILTGGDARRLLMEAIGTVPSALLVMSSHGASGFGDVPSGDTAGFILARCGIPVLMIRRPEDYDVAHICQEAESKGVRHPSVHNR